VVVHTSHDGDVALFYRGDSPQLYCRLRRPDGLGWVQRSTKCNHPDEAFKRAQGWHDELRLGLTTDPKLSSLVADRCLEDLQREVDLGLRNPRHVRDYKPVVERYLKPFFGQMMIDEVNNTKVEEYRRWRGACWIAGPGSEQRIITYWRKGQQIRRPMRRGGAPARSTLVAEDVVLREIFQSALKYGFIRHWQIPTITWPAPKRRNLDARRAAFTLEEYKQLAVFMAEWWQSGRNFHRRLLLMLYVHVLIHSGMRPAPRRTGCAGATSSGLVTARRGLTRVCSRTTARMILDRGGDYCLALKGNQPALFDDVRLWLDDPATGVDDACQTVDGDHGRIETRRAMVAHDVAWLVERHDFPGLAAVAKVTATREIDDKSTTATRYYLLSRPLATARVAQIVRAHWQIEKPAPLGARRGHGRGWLARPQEPRAGKPRPAAPLRAQSGARQPRVGLHPRQDQTRRLGRRFPAPCHGR
jgi:hypothetical protein